MLNTSAWTSWTRMIMSTNTWKNSTGTVLTQCLPYPWQCGFTWTTVMMVWTLFWKKSANRNKMRWVCSIHKITPKQHWFCQGSLASHFSNEILSVRGSVRLKIDPLFLLISNSPFSVVTPLQVFKAPVELTSSSTTSSHVFLPPELRFFIENLKSGDKVKVVITNIELTVRTYATKTKNITRVKEIYFSLLKCPRGWNQVNCWVKLHAGYTCRRIVNASTVR